MGRQLYGSPMALGPRRVVGGTGAKCAPVRVAPVRAPQKMRSGRICPRTCLYGIKHPIF